MLKDIFEQWQPEDLRKAGIVYGYALAQNYEEALLDIKEAAEKWPLARVLNGLFGPLQWSRKTDIILHEFREWKDEKAGIKKFEASVILKMTIVIYRLDISITREVTKIGLQSSNEKPTAFNLAKGVAERSCEKWIKKEMFGEASKEKLPDKDQEFEKKSYEPTEKEKSEQATLIDAYRPYYGRTISCMQASGHGGKPPYFYPSLGHAFGPLEITSEYKLKKHDYMVQKAEVGTVIHKAHVWQRRALECYKKAKEKTLFSTQAASLVKYAGEAIRLRVGFRVKDLLKQLDKEVPELLFTFKISDLDAMEKDLKLQRKKLGLQKEAKDHLEKKGTPKAKTKKTEKDEVKAVKHLFKKFYEAATGKGRDTVEQRKGLISFVCNIDELADIKGNQKALQCSAAWTTFLDTLADYNISPSTWYKRSINLVRAELGRYAVIERKDTLSSWGLAIGLGAGFQNDINNSHDAWTAVNLSCTSLRITKLVNAELV